MRKKLLALMMCATMVLGTATTAFAAAKPAEADYDAAESILKAGSKFVSEYKISDEKKVTWTQTNDDGKNITWGLVGFDKAVKLDEDGDALVKASDLTVQDFKKNTAGEYVNAANVAIGKKVGDTMYFYINSAATTATTNTDNVAADLMTTTVSVGTPITDAALVEKVKAQNPSASTATLYPVEVGGSSVVGYATVGADTQYYFSLVDKNGYKATTTLAAVATASTTVTPINYAKKAVPYTAADFVYGANGYYPTLGANGVVVYDVNSLSQTVYDVDKEGFINKKSGESLKKLGAGIASGYYVDLSSYNGTAVDYKKAIANSLVGNNTVKLSDKAVAIKLSLYELVKNGKVNGCQLYKLVQKDSSATDVTLTFKSDFLSHSKLDASSIHAYTIDKDDKDSDGIMQIQDLNKVADGFTFTAKDFTNLIFIFDAEAVASTDNAGQADADATKPATTDKADKTGDTAPIAALAVVMLGACGAMVVASKKRA